MKEKKKQHFIHDQVIETLEEMRKKKGLLTQDEIRFIETLVEEPFDPETFVDKQFQDFKINDLTNHQQTIMNVFYQFQSG